MCKAMKSALKLPRTGAYCSKIVAKVILRSVILGIFVKKHYSSNRANVKLSKYGQNRHRRDKKNSFYQATQVRSLHIFQ